MSDFKFGVGDEVESQDGTEKGTVAHAFCNAQGKNEYCVQLNGEDCQEVYREADLWTADTTPLDANGIEIGVGDLAENELTGVIGRITEIRCNGDVALNSLKTDRVTVGPPENLNILEEAPPPQITLGSRVRVKGRDDVVGVIAEGRGSTNHQWRINGDGHFRSESELELIEDGR